MRKLGGGSYSDDSSSEYDYAEPIALAGAANRTRLVCDEEVGYSVSSLGDGGATSQ